MSSNENENKTNASEPRRIRVITGLAVEYTVGDESSNDAEVIDGNQQVTEDEIRSVCKSEQMSVLCVLMEQAFIQFAKMYPSACANAKIIPINGLPEVDMIDVEV